MWLKLSSRKGRKAMEVGSSLQEGNVAIELSLHGELDVWMFVVELLRKLSSFLVCEARL
jgi:hypothetical protein